MAPNRMPSGGNGEFLPSRCMPPVGAQSLPATPSSTNVRTFTDYSGEHTRLTTLHGSTGALEVNNLGGFTTSIANGSNNKLASALESSIDGIVRTTPSVSASMNGMGMGEYGSGLNSHMGTGRNGNGVEHLGLGPGMGHGMMHVKTTGSNNGMPSGMPVHILTSVSSGTGMGNGMAGQFHSNMLHSQHSQPAEVGGGDNGIHDVDDMADVFTGLSFKEPALGAAPGYGRSRLRRSSAPVGNGDQGSFGAVGSGQNGYGLWGIAGAGNGGENEFVAGGPGGNGSDGMTLPGVNQVGRDYGLMPPISRNSPVPPQQQQQQQQQHMLHQPHHHHNTSQYPGGVVGGASGSFSAGIGPHGSFKTAWSSGAPQGSNNPPHLRLSLGVPGLGGTGGADSSSGGMASQHGPQSIWSQSSFHHNAGIGMGVTNNSASITTPNSSNGSNKPATNTVNIPSTSNNNGNNGNPSMVANNSSRPNSQTSSYSGSDSSLSGISPIYSPTNITSGFSGFGSSGNGSQPASTSDSSYPPTTLGLGLFPTGPLGMLNSGGGGDERESRSPFRVSVSIMPVIIC